MEDWEGAGSSRSASMEEIQPLPEPSGNPEESRQVHKRQGLQTTLLLSPSGAENSNGRFQRVYLKSLQAELFNTTSTSVGIDLYVSRFNVLSRLKCLFW